MVPTTCCGLSRERAGMASHWTPPRRPAVRRATFAPMHPARRAWTHVEPIHAIVYFAPEKRAAYEQAGLRGGWMGYFASRAAAMGPVDAPVVAAIFQNFAPAMVARAIPDAWRYSSPQRALEARHAAVDAALRRLWGDAAASSDGVTAAAEML